MYIILGTRPDIAYAVSVISRFSAKPAEVYINTVKRVFRYLKNILFIGLDRAMGPWAGSLDLGTHRNYPRPH
jgi:hypothetical protein